MAMRLRRVIVDTIGYTKWEALCAANSQPEQGDIYIDDSQDHAIRVKLQADWLSEGYMFINESAQITKLRKLITRAHNLLTGLPEIMGDPLSDGVDVVCCLLEDGVIAAKGAGVKLC